MIRDTGLLDGILLRPLHAIIFRVARRKLVLQYFCNWRQICGLLASTRDFTCEGILKSKCLISEEYIPNDLNLPWFILKRPDGIDGYKDDPPITEMGTVLLTLRPSVGQVALLVIAFTRGWRLKSAAMVIHVLLLLCPLFAIFFIHVHWTKSCDQFLLKRAISNIRSCRSQMFVNCVVEESSC